MDFWLKTDGSHLFPKWEKKKGSILAEKCVTEVISDEEDMLNIVWFCHHRNVLISIHSESN